MPHSDPPARGLPAVHQGRRVRLRFPSIPPRFWLWVFVVLAVWAIVYWKYTQGQLESARNRIMAKQRAVAAEVGSRFFPLRDQLEAWVIAGAADFPGDFVAPEALQSDFRTKPGVYLRLLVDDAREPDKIREAATLSLRDGFTSCLTRANNPDPYAGPACQFNRDCPSGQHCNETLHCSEPAQPYNLRIAYRATRVLTESWVRDVRDANDMRLRLLQRDLDTAVKEDVPFAIDIIVRGQYFLFVLDEKASPDVPLPDAGSLSESLQSVEHPARVFIYDMKQRKLLLRARSSATADVGVGTTDPKIALAVRRQANNCALGLVVRKMLGDDGVP